MKFKIFFSILTVIILITGCTQPPLDEMANAREAVFRAESDPNASMYAAGSLARARDSLQRMQTEADSKNYDAARTYAAEAAAAAERAINEGRAAAQRAEAEANTLVSGLRAEIDEANRNLNGARYSQMDLDYDAMESGIINAYNAVDQAEAALSSGMYQDAADIVGSIRTNLTDLNYTIASSVPPGKK